MKTGTNNVLPASCRKSRPQVQERENSSDAPSVDVRSRHGGIQMFPVRLPHSNPFHPIRGGCARISAFRAPSSAFNKYYQTNPNSKNRFACKQRGLRDSVSNLDEKRTHFNAHPTVLVCTSHQKGAHPRRAEKARTRKIHSSRPLHRPRTKNPKGLRLVRCRID